MDAEGGHSRCTLESGRRRQWRGWEEVEGGDNGGDERRWGGGR